MIMTVTFGRPPGFGSAIGCCKPAPKSIPPRAGESADASKADDSGGAGTRTSRRRRLHPLWRGDPQQVEGGGELGQRGGGERQARGADRRGGLQDRAGGVELREGLAEAIGVLGRRARGVPVIGLGERGFEG